MLVRLGGACTENISDMRTLCSCVVLMRLVETIILRPLQVVHSIMHDGSQAIVGMLMITSVMIALSRGACENSPTFQQYVFYTGASIAATMGAISLCCPKPTVALEIWHMDKTMRHALNVCGLLAATVTIALEAATHSEVAMARLEEFYVLGYVPLYLKWVLRDGYRPEQVLGNLNHPPLPELGLVSKGLLFGFLYCFLHVILLRTFNVADFVTSSVVERRYGSNLGEYSSYFSRGGGGGGRNVSPGGRKKKSVVTEEETKTEYWVEPTQTEEYVEEEDYAEENDVQVLEDDDHDDDQEQSDEEEEEQTEVVEEEEEYVAPPPQPRQRKGRANTTTTTTTNTANSYTEASSN